MAMLKRRKQGRTNYAKRLKMVASGAYRLVARRSLKNIMLQIIEYKKDGDIILAASHSRELKKYGWPYSNKNTSAAYLLGLLIAVKAKKSGLKECIFDFGLENAMHGGVLFAALKGAVDGGLKIPHDSVALPKEDRINGEHIAKYARELSKEKYSKIFSNYIKANARPEEIKNKFDDAKKKILSG